MPPKCTTAKSSTCNAPSHHLSTCIAAKAMPPVTAPQAPPPDDKETIDIDAELTNNEADSNSPSHGLAVVAQAMANSESGIPSGGPIPKKAAPSIPLELATTQGHTAQLMMSGISFLPGVIIVMAYNHQIFF